MIGGMKRRVAFGLALLASLGPASVSEALPLGPSTGPLTRVEFCDNTASLTYGEKNGSGSSVVAKPNDPVTFHVYAFPPAPGTSVAFLRVELYNNTTGEVRFPGGLKVPVILSRDGVPAVVTVVRHSATSLAPGTGVQADATASLPGFGQYSASAFTVARFSA